MVAAEGVMVIGLVRHFKVDYSKNKWMTPQELLEWIMRYDDGGVLPRPFDARGVSWQKCYSSDLPRAMHTSRGIFSGEITATPLLREVPMSPPFKSRVPLPYFFWYIAGRFCWFFGTKSQQESARQSRERARTFLDSLEDTDGGILLVTHGVFMHPLQKELLRRGFKGRFINAPRNGGLYIFRKD